MDWIERHSSIRGRGTARSASIVDQQNSVIESSDQLTEILGVDDPELLRAAALSRVLRRGGRLFANAKGSAETWGLSHPVDKIDCFISHNWSVGRWLKFVGLAVHFNLSLGLAIAFVSIVAGLIFTEVCGVGRPAIHYVTTPVMLAAVLCGRDIFFCLGFRGPVVFIDKCSIHQTDEKRKERGIKKLGAFMRFSDSVLACYTDVYLRKLWTVYEVCTFLTVNDARNLHVLPMSLPTAVLCSSVCAWIGGCIAIPVINQQTVDATDPDVTAEINIWALVACLDFVFLFPITLFCWHLMTQNARLDDAVNSFDVRTAACFCEDDRALVESSVVELARHLKIERSEVHHDVLLEEFNARVRSEVPRAIQQSRGRYGVPLRATFLIVIPMFTTCMEFARLRVPPGRLDQELAINLRKWTALCLAGPVLCQACKGCVGARGASLAARIILANTVATFIFVVACGGAEAIAMAAVGVARSEAAPQAYLWARLFLTVLLLAWLYRPEHRAKARIPELTEERAEDRRLSTFEL